MSMGLLLACGLFCMLEEVIEEVIGLTAGRGLLVLGVVDGVTIGDDLVGVVEGMVWFMLGNGLVEVLLMMAGLVLAAGLFCIPGVSLLCVSEGVIVLGVVVVVIWLIEGGCLIVVEGGLTVG